MQTLYLIDASVYVFRAYFSIPASMVAPNGQPVNAVYGFAGFLCQFLERAEPRFLACAFDKSLTTSFRNEFYPAYKAQRELPPPELEAQFEHCMALTRALGLPTFVDDRYEADDIIGTLAAKLRPYHFQIVVLTSDKDLAQILEPGDNLWDFGRDRLLDIDGVTEHFGVRASQIIDYLALVGDKVDNIPGVAGIGSKTAAALLSHFGTLEQLYARLDEVPHLDLRGASRIAEKLRAQQDAAFLSQRLARIACDMPLNPLPEHLAWGRPDRPALAKLFNTLGFGQGIRGRLEALLKKNHPVR